MTPTSLNLQYALLGENYSPSLIDERGDELMYVGYCLPTCTGPDCPKWLIKKILKREVSAADGTPYTIQAILYPSGDRDYAYKWSERETYAYTLSPRQDTYNSDNYR